ncbi:MAG: AAA family ATPase, partial [Oscillospiraceae bacterium]|nr:AAA family ATPase [Oscillospiraceae bacterium]
MNDLIAWKNKKNRQPLILKGARQVGKTWLLNEFGRTAFEDALYVNMENAPGLKESFEGDISPRKVIDLLGALHGKRIKPRETLLIFDEVQEIPRALTALKYFAEAAPEYAVCCAGSLLGVALHSGTSFPVGKVDFLTLQPLNFEEFLIANGENTLVEYVKSHAVCAIERIITEKLSEYLKQYFVIGGMPGAVSAWLETRDYSVVEGRQRDILETYENDFSKHAPRNAVPKLRYLWNSVPSQLARENKKFIYGLVR